MRRLLLVAGAAALVGTAGFGATRAQPPPAAVAAKPMDAKERRAVLTDLAQKLEHQFVFPDVARRYAAVLRDKLAGGAYDEISDPVVFGETVTADLQKVHPDLHLRVAPLETFQRRRPPEADAPRSSIGGDPFGLEEARMIGDVAYLRFNAFPNEPGTAEKARAFLLAHAGVAKAIIIDARPHRGGGLDVMDAILPLFYGRQTTLVRMDTRASAAHQGYLQEGPTLIRQPSSPELVRQDHVISPDEAETRLRKTPLFYLTSRRTASAAEHLALSLKLTKRATLIGETTRGAGHYGGRVQIGERFAAFIPVGRTYDIATNWDWEGKGVTPDIPVHADDALDEALKAARAAGADPAD